MRSPAVSLTTTGLVVGVVATALWLWRKKKECRSKSGQVDGLESITAELQFGGGTHSDEMSAVAVATVVYDGRGDPSRFELHSSGFQLVEASAAAAVTKNVDVYDPEATVAGLFPVAEAMVTRLCPGATRALAFDHIVRNPARLKVEAEQAAKERSLRPPAPPRPTLQPRQASEPVRRRLHGPERHPSLNSIGHHHSLESATHELLAALSTASSAAKLVKSAARPLRTRFLQGTLPHAHGDYTARSGMTRAHQLLEPYAGAEALDEALGQHRVAIVNVWLPLRLVESDPLAMCTWPSCGPRDVRTSRLHFPTRYGETYKVVPGAHQRWVYFSRVRPGEAVLLKTYDSCAEPGVARFCLHTAFSLPGQLDHSRQSLEIRVLVLYAPNAGRLLRGDFEPPHVAHALRSHTQGVIEVPDRAETLPPSDDW